MKYYILALKNAFDFRTRSSRPEYWYFVLFNVIFTIVAMIIDNVLGTTFKFSEEVGGSLPYGYFYALNALITFIPGLAAAVRRLHDVSKSGWMLLIAIIPLIGGIWLLVLLAKESAQGENKWGYNPNDTPLIDGDLLKM